MTDKEITYTTVRFHRSSKLQNRARPDETQRSREAVHRECTCIQVSSRTTMVPYSSEEHPPLFPSSASSVVLPWRTACSSLSSSTWIVSVSPMLSEGCTFDPVVPESSTPWHFIVIPLGILCFILLVTVAVLVTLIFQCSQEKYDQNNLNQSTVQNTSASDKILTNKSSEYEGRKNQEEQNRCCGKTKAVLDYGKYTGKCAEAHLFCCGIKCYYFIMDNKRWNDCKNACQDCRLSLLKIDDDDELKFLKYQFTGNTLWIGLFYETSKSEWKWIDNGTFKLDLMKPKLLKENGGCAHLSFRGIQEGDCAAKHPCICEKRMDRFPG